MKLKVGDKIYKSQYGALTFIGTIERVTEKRAFTKNNCFNIEIEGSDFVRVIPIKEWGGSYFIGNEKVDAEYAFNNIKKIVCNFSYVKLPNDKIIEIYNLIKQ